MRPNRTKQRLGDAETVYGCFVRYADASRAELVALQGFDFLMLGADESAARAWAARGARFIAVTVDSLLARGARGLLAAVREQRDG